MVVGVVGPHWSRATKQFAGAPTATTAAAAAAAAAVFVLFSGSPIRYFPLPTLHCCFVVTVSTKIMGTIVLFVESHRFAATLKLALVTVAVWLVQLFAVFFGTRPATVIVRGVGSIVIIHFFVATGKSTSW